MYEYEFMQQLDDTMYSEDLLTQYLEFYRESVGKLKAKRNESANWKKFDGIIPLDVLVERASSYVLQANSLRIDAKEQINEYNYVNGFDIIEESLKRRMKRRLKLFKIVESGKVNSKDKKWFKNTGMLLGKLYSGRVEVSKYADMKLRDIAKETAIVDEYDTWLHDIKVSRIIRLAIKKAEGKTGTQWLKGGIYAGLPNRTH